MNLILSQKREMNFGCLGIEIPHYVYKFVITSARTVYVVEIMDPPACNGEGQVISIIEAVKTQPWPPSVLWVFLQELGQKVYVSGIA
jgi:hypothetical protein